MHVGGGGVFRVSHVVGRSAFALAPWQREGRFALRLGEAAGQLGEGLDERVALGDAHLPQLHLLTSRPLLRHLLVNLPTLPQVRLVPQHNDCHLRTQQKHRKQILLSSWYISQQFKNH